MMDLRPEGITACRISGSRNLVPVLDLGTQALTGVFPKDRHAPITSGPLELVWCQDSGLLQLNHSYDSDEMYGINYGYRSSLNQSMVNHLRNKVQYLQRLRPVTAGDIVLDIGSNDATLLASYEVNGLRRLGIDPTGIKFQEAYKDGMELIPKFFSAAAFREKVPQGRAKIVTSIAMFYDLESPGAFVADIYDVLDDKGIWHLEQSYMPTMLSKNLYDTVCHEHLEYYSLAVIKRLLENHGLQIIDVQLNDVNGGSFAVTVARQGSGLPVNDVLIRWVLRQEELMGLDTVEPFLQFKERVFAHRDRLVDLISKLKHAGKTLVGYGASTKGNVLLQFCGFTENEITCIADVNPDKFGAFTPGSGIPIVSEHEARALKPDYMLVLPWHFRHSIIAREQEYLQGGGKLIFPLPEVEVV